MHKKQFENASFVLYSHDSLNYITNDLEIISNNNTIIELSNNIIEDAFSFYDKELGKTK